jgi:NADP-dependent 3-hydroxy acid dehydrogenase YdfG
MTTTKNKTAIIVGASAGVGRATAAALIAEGATVIAVARRMEGLASLRAELGERLIPVAADGADPSTAPRLLREYRPEHLVLAGGNRPEMGPIDELSWESFSATWNSDVRSSFYFMREALSAPLPPGSCVVVLSSGAAMNGSYLSGGYAGAKRMQWLLAGYLQQLSTQRKLGMRFLSLIPKQLIEGTEIGALASSTYGKTQGITAADYMKRFEIPLDAARVADAILQGLRGQLGDTGTAFTITGKGVEPIG